MNDTGTITYEKIMIPIRLTPETYEKLIDAVQAKKKVSRGYSINQFVTSLIEKELKLKKNF